MRDNKNGTSQNQEHLLFSQNISCECFRLGPGAPLKRPVLNYREKMEGYVCTNRNHRKSIKW